MKKLLVFVLVLGILCFYGCTGVSVPINSPNELQTNTPPNTNAAQTTPPETVQPTDSASIVAIGKIEEEGFPTTSLELSVEGDYERLDAKLTARTGDASSNDLQEFVVEYEDIWEHFSNQSEFETFKVENGYLISVQKVVGHGHLEALIAAYFDGETLKRVDFPFNDIGYYGSDTKLFEMEWTGDTTFSLKSNLSGETKNYEVNIAHYESENPGPFSEFDKTIIKAHILSELFILQTGEQLKINARLAYGDSLSPAIDTFITLEFNASTCSYEYQSIEYEIQENSVKEI